MMQMNRGNYERQDSESFSLFDIVLDGIAVGVVYFTILALAFIGKTVFTAVVSPTFPALVKSFAAFSATELSVSSCLTVALEGVVVGLFIGCLRRLHIKRKIAKPLTIKQREIGKSFISNLLTFQLFKFEISLVFVIVLNIVEAFVGGIVGFIQGVITVLVVSSSKK